EKNCTGTFFLGLITVAYASWNVGTLIGAVLSDILPAVVTASLGIALYAMFIGILVPGLRGNLRLFVLVAATGVCSFVLNLFMESSRALIISTLVCAFSGVFFVDLGEENADEKH
ncbi:MAG: branched-chain amino acid ABC transporter permease, partial [Eubacteriales bacterium]